MEQLLSFLDANLNQSGPAERSKKYRCGVVRTDLIDSLDSAAADLLTLARIAYVKNLALVEPQPFEVPAGPSPAERALMYLSFRDYASAYRALGLPLVCEVVGAEATGHTGAASSTLVLRLSNTESSELSPFAYGTLAFNTFQITPLSYLELLFLYIKINELQQTTDHCELSEFHIPAYINRALHGTDDLDDALRLALLMKHTEATNEVCKLEAAGEGRFCISEELFSYPITFRSDVRIQTGLSLMACYDYGAALAILQDYPLYEQRIKCMIAQRDTEGAVAEIEAYIATFGSPSEREEQIALSNLYIKLAHLRQNPEYFDVAASLFRSAKPHQLKGLWHYNRKEHAAAKAAFQEALRITPCSEEIRFSYGCTLVELDEAAEALKVFRLLNAENPTNENISKNLSYCYYRLKDIESTLGTLRSVALHDQGAMKQFLYLSINSGRTDNIRWALQRISDADATKNATRYLLENGMFEAADLRSVLASNQYVDADAIDALLACAP
ncbi:hypothetical protein PAPHI01_1756 [Pancytospora philotis]|nr:hypothetical protein PAPHI01_1756 [Pancytospora philotis]